MEDYINNTVVQNIINEMPCYNELNEIAKQELKDYMLKNINERR